MEFITAAADTAITLEQARQLVAGLASLASAGNEAVQFAAPPAQFVAFHNAAAATAAANFRPAQQTLARGASTVRIAEAYTALEKCFYVSAARKSLNPFERRRAFGTPNYRARESTVKRVSYVTF